MYEWKIITKDGKELKESDGHEWLAVKDNIKNLSLINSEGHIVSLPENLDNYIQAKTASADIGGNNIQIESRYIGTKIGSNTILIRINEKNNNINIEIE